MSQKAGRIWIPKFCFFSLRQTEGDEGEDATQSCQASPTLHEHPHPAANSAWGVSSTPPTSDSGSNQKPRGLWPNAHPLDHVGDVFSSQMCVYIPQNVPKPPRNRNLKNQNFDPVRIRTQVYRVIYGDYTTRPLVLYRNIRNEYINLIWHHLVSHINFRFLK